ncbi:nucleoporin NUP188-like [Clytia hemisphaerica]
MLSTRELWSIVTGGSSLKDKVSIGEEIKRFNPLFESILDFYKKPNTESEKKITSTAGVKRKPFILKLSKILDLDEWQTHELFLNYLRIDFRGSGPQLQAILKHDTQLEGFYLKLSEFYYKERLFLLKCIKYFITHWQDESCLYREEFAKVVDLLASKNIALKIIEQIKQLLKRPANHVAIKGNQIAETERANEYAREMCELAEILFLYYKDFEMPFDIFQDLALLFRRHHFGTSQVNQKLLTLNGLVQIQKFELISSMILVEGIDLEVIRKTTAEDISEIKDHSLLQNENWKKIDKLLYSWDDMEQQGPVLIAWTIFRHMCLPQDEKHLTAHFGESAMRCNVMLYLRHILDFPSYKKLGDGVSCLLKSHVYILVSMVLKVFQEDTLGDFKNLIEIASKVLEEPILSSLFLMEDQTGGIGLLLKSAKRCFPHAVLPYIHLLKSVCTDADSADIVFDSLESQETFTELFGLNAVDEISAVDDRIWQRKISRKIIEMDNDSIILDQGVYGRTFQDREDARLIQWNMSYSGWLYALLELNKIIESPMTYTTGSGEDGISVAKEYISLVSAILTSRPDKINEFEPIIGSLIVLIKRLSHLKTCPIDLMTECLKCLNLVMLKQPLEVWHHLTKIQFLPFQKKSSLSSNEMLPGSYGNILTTVEIPNHMYDVTKEYLQIIMTLLELPYETLINAGKQNELYMDLAVNIVLIIKEIFSHFGRWKFSSAEDKELIALKCLEIFHQLLSPKNEESLLIKEKNLPSLKEIVSDGLLYHGAGESLLAIISVGVDSLSVTLHNDVRQGTDVIQVLKLSFAVLNHLLTSVEKKATLTPLEEVLSQHFVQQPSDLDFMHPFCNMTMLSVIAKFIFHQQDPKLPILAVLTLRTLAIRFPLILTSSLGDALIGIRNAFVNRLNGRVEAIRLKVAILEFLSSCVESQPGIIECFINIQQDKEKKTVVGQFSCLPAILEILENKQQVDVLTSTALEFVAALWKNRYDGAMSILKNSKTFWESVTSSLKLGSSSEAATYEPLQHSLNIIGTETYYIKSEQFDERLKAQLTPLCNENFYKNILKVFEPHTDTVLCQKKIAVMKSFQTLITVMSKLEDDYCSLCKKEVKDLLSSSITKIMKQWVFSEDVSKNRNVIVEIASFTWLLIRTWKGTIVEHQDIVSTLTECLTELSTSDRTIFAEVVFPVYMSILALLQTQNKAVIGSTLYLNLLKLVIQNLHHHDEKSEQFTKHTQVNIASISLMTELVLQISKDSLPSVIETFQSRGTIQNLLRDMTINLQKRIDLEYVETVLRFMLSSSQKDLIAEHLHQCGIGKFKCLNLNNVQAARKSSQVAREIWSLILSLTARLLKKLRFTFLQVAVDFLGAYEEDIFQSMNLMEEMTNGSCLLISEQIAILCFELAHYDHDIEFLLPDIHQKLKYGVAQMVKLSVALLARQKLITHLTEFKSTDDLHQMIRGTKEPSPVSFRSDSVRSGYSTADFEKLTGLAEVAQNRLISILCYCLGSLRRITPSVVEAILDEGMDIDSFTPLVDFKFNSPTLEMEDNPTFGSLLACVNIALKMIYKLVQGDSEHVTPEKDVFNTSLPTDADKQRSHLWFIVENSLIVTISQASCYLRHPNINEGGKQFLKRELGSELTNIRHAVQRYRSRRGIPPSPESSERLSASSMSSFRRSPSKLSSSISLNEEEENSVLKLVDTYTRYLLR